MRLLENSMDAITENVGLGVQIEDIRGLLQCRKDRIGITSDFSTWVRFDKVR